MLSQLYYLLRSKADGRYLVAHASQQGGTTESSYLLLFCERFDALSYLNTHAAALANRFAIESVPSNQLASLLKRWEFTGVGIVRDPLLPKIEFLTHK
jgi:hypothetical protein